MQRRRVGSGWVCSGWHSMDTAAKGREQQGKREEQTGNREINRRVAQNQKETGRETGTITENIGKETHTIRDITKHTKAGAHAQGPTNTDAEHKEAPHPPTTLEQRPYRGRH